MTSPFLDASNPHPMRLPNGQINTGLVHLSRVVSHPNLTIGDYTYTSAFDAPQDWAARLAPYTYPGAPERIRIGRFCQIANGVQIITGSANHPMAGFSTYPFAIFDFARLRDYVAQLGAIPDTEIGNDVWLGDGATVLPGARIGNGVIVGARAVVGGEIPDYAIVVGNPGRVLRMRFAPDVIARLLALRWWDWPLDAIERATPALAASDIDALERLAPAST